MKTLTWTLYEETMREDQQCSFPPLSKTNFSMPVQKWVKCLRVWQKHQLVWYLNTQRLISLCINSDIQRCATSLMKDTWELQLNGREKDFYLTRYPLKQNSQIQCISVLYWMIGEWIEPSLVSWMERFVLLAMTCGYLCMAGSTGFSKLEMAITVYWESAADWGGKN